MKKLGIFRNIIFIGWSGNKSIYFDTVSKQALETVRPPFFLKGQKKSKRFWLMSLLTALVLSNLARSLLLQVWQGQGVFYTKDVILALLLWWLLASFLFCGLVEKFLYPDIRDLRPTTSKTFRHAVYSNNFFRFDRIKKVTVARKCGYFLLLLVLPLLSLVMLGRFLLALGEAESQTVQVDSSFLIFFMAFCLFASTYVMLFQNNPYRWSRVVESYQKRKIKWGDISG